MSDPKTETRQQFGISEDEPTGWFETLYSAAGKDGAGVPWANMAVHPAFADWLTRNPLNGEGKTALVVGCGMGDDAIELEALGFDVTAFDVSDTAIAFCKERFPDSRAAFLQADVLEDQPRWSRKFDFVLEIFTVQALPPKYEAALIGSIAHFVAPGGQLLVVAEVAEDPRRFKNGPPWLLTPDHVEAFAAQGLTVEARDRRPSDFEGADHLSITAFRCPE